ncbi:MAG: isoprenylcysteine carboxylmethyltransferase family protein [Firmicutes bacterium]|nr:isoprenylcysteine carboxylmethyltransferase family protein [Bacillota bacterium]
MHKAAINYALRVFVQRILALVLFLLGSGWALNWTVGLYFGTNFLAAAVSMVYMYNVSPETLAQRGKVVTDSPVWDKLLLGLYWLLHFFVIHLAAGLEFKNAIQNMTVFWTGIILVVGSTILSLAALKVNTFLESTARLQTERGQTVIREGVYGVVRHPTYSAVLLSCLGISLVFQTPFVCLVALISTVLIVVRTYLEDKMLQENLAGYKQYVRDVRYRLIPFVW